MPENLELTVASDPQNLARIAEFVMDAALRLGLGEQQAFEVQMATDEACTNIIEHAYGLGRAGEIHLTCGLEGDDLVVTIRDRGCTFEPDQVPEPDRACSLEDRLIGGLGLFFMRRLMDRLVFHCDPDRGNELKMYKRRNP